MKDWSWWQALIDPACHTYLRMRKKPIISGVGGITRPLFAVKFGEQRRQNLFCSSMYKQFAATLIGNKTGDRYPKNLLSYKRIFYIN